MYPSLHPNGFLMFSEGRERVHWERMGSGKLQPNSTSQTTKCVVKNHEQMSLCRAAIAMV